MQSALPCVLESLVVKVQAPSADAQEGVARAAEVAIEANLRVKGLDVPFDSEVEIARKQMGVVEVDHLSGPFTTN
jgi:hypothetical protein